MNGVSRRKCRGTGAHGRANLEFDYREKRSEYIKNVFLKYVGVPNAKVRILCYLCAYISIQGRAQASALGAQPNALLTIWNLQDLQSKGPVRYGDMLFLQIGRHEVREHCCSAKQSF